MRQRNRILIEQYEQQKQWFQELSRWQGSVIPVILPKVLLFMVMSVGITGLYVQGINLALPIKSGLIPSIVLGLLLVFRTNTAYDRFWEGRKLWGSLINNVRNLSRLIWVAVQEKNHEDRLAKQQALRLLEAFAIAMKLHLRGEKVNQELVPLMSPDFYETLQHINHPPLEIAFWISDYLQQQSNRDRINPYQLNAMFQLLDDMVDTLGACERILKTPIPAAYAIHLKQLVFLYCLTLPFELVDQLVWFTAPLVGLVSFAIFGIEAIGVEIENPFGYDANDLPLDQICQTIQRNLEDLIRFTPDDDPGKRA
ncbi:MAG: bestrophin family ion channel [Merismopediaceae bacterium]|nr:bestrophin family ion channel [Merismopediaceae bacterium]